jgi:hypothetical protein
MTMKKAHNDFSVKWRINAVQVKNEHRGMKDWSWHSETHLVGDGQCNFTGNISIITN